MSAQLDLDAIRAIAERGERHQRAAQAALGALRPELADLDRDLTAALLALGRAEAEPEVLCVRERVQDTRAEVRALLEKVRA